MRVSKNKNWEIRKRNYYEVILYMLCYNFNLWFWLYLNQLKYFGGSVVEIPKNWLRFYDSLVCLLFHSKFALTFVTALISCCVVCVSCWVIYVNTCSDRCYLKWMGAKIQVSFICKSWLSDDLSLRYANFFDVFVSLQRHSKFRNCRRLDTSLMVGLIILA